MPAGRVAIVSNNLARELWGQPPAALGKQIRIGRVGALTEIIGVAGDIYDSGVDQPPPAIVYWRAGYRTHSGLSRRSSCAICRLPSAAIKQEPRI